jgi:hypothetical protein
LKPGAIQPKLAVDPAMGRSCTVASIDNGSSLRVPVTVLNRKPDVHIERRHSPDDTRESLAFCKIGAADRT